MPRKEIYGLQHNQEERKEKVLRDIRSGWQRFSEALLSREGFATAGLAMCLWLVFEPGFWPFPVLIFAVVYKIRASVTRQDHLPMRMPAVYKGTDYNNPAPGKGFKKASGMFYIGNDTFEGNDELWIGKDDILTHMLVLGTTGAGKTETLVSLCYNYFAVGSGLIYVDPKAAPKLGAQIYTMARLLGRDDDFLLINYMADKLGQESMLKHGHTRIPVRQSNTQNPFAVGDANQLTQLLFALMPGDDNGSNSIFANNAQTLISGLMFVLVERRNKGEEELSIESIRHYLMEIPEIDRLARGELGQYSETAMLALQAGLGTVGWDKSKKLKEQPKNFPEQYGYARAYFGRALSLLVDNYGRIFKTSHGEVDTVDVITSRRIFVTLIPSMDKDPKELKSLGQICLASVRNACAVGLGDKVQGQLADVLGALPTESRAPFGIIVDEYAAIETPGFEILLTQGRGLGMAVIVASQDMAGIKRASEAAAEQIVSNCKVKIFMTTEDPNQTYNLVKELAGESYVLKSSGYSINKDLDSSSYYDNQQVSAEKMARVDFRDLQKQIEGDVTISFKGEVIRGRTFYAAPPLKDDQHVRLAYMLKCLSPDVSDLKQRFGDLKSLRESLYQLAESWTAGGVEDSEPEPQQQADLDGLAKYFRIAAEHPEEVRNDIAIAAVVLYDSLGLEGEHGEVEVSDEMPVGLHPEEMGVSFAGEFDDEEMEEVTDSPEESSEVQTSGIVSGSMTDFANPAENARHVCGDETASEIKAALDSAPGGDAAPLTMNDSMDALDSMLNSMNFMDTGKTSGKNDDDGD